MKEWIVKYWIEVLFGAVAVGFGAIYKRLSKKLKRQICDQKALKDGTKALLRNSIIQMYDKYTEREQIPIYAMENVNEMYEAYHALGGNGTITKLMDALRALPCK